MEWRSDPDEEDFIKRVIGVGGDHVVCCDDAGPASRQRQAAGRGLPLHRADGSADQPSRGAVRRHGAGGPAVGDGRPPSASGDSLEQLPAVTPRPRSRLDHPDRRRGRAGVRASSGRSTGRLAVRAGHLRRDSGAVDRTDATGVVAAATGGPSTSWHRGGRWTARYRAAPPGCCSLDRAGRCCCSSGFDPARPGARATGSPSAAGSTDGESAARRRGPRSCAEETGLRLTADELGEPVWHRGDRVPLRRPSGTARNRTSSLVRVPVLAGRHRRASTPIERRIDRRLPLVVGPDELDDHRRAVLPGRPAGSAAPGCWRRRPSRPGEAPDADAAAHRGPPRGRPVRPGAGLAAAWLRPGRRGRRGRPGRLRRPAGGRRGDPARGPARRDRRAGRLEAAHPGRPGSGSTTRWWPGRWRTRWWSSRPRRSTPRGLHVCNLAGDAPGARRAAPSARTTC